jgi:hypothetical protein
MLVVPRTRSFRRSVKCIVVEVKPMGSALWKCIKAAIDWNGSFLPKERTE